MILTLVNLDVQWNNGSLARDVTFEDLPLDAIETFAKFGRTLTDTFGNEAHVQMAMVDNDIRVINKTVQEVREALENAGLTEGYELIDIAEEDQGAQLERG